MMKPFPTFAVSTLGPALNLVSRVSVERQIMPSFGCLIVINHETRLMIIFVEVLANSVASDLIASACIAMEDYGFDHFFEPSSE